MNENDIQTICEELQKIKQYHEKIRNDLRVEINKIKGEVELHNDMIEAISSIINILDKEV